MNRGDKMEIDEKMVKIEVPPISIREWSVSGYAIVRSLSGNIPNEKSGSEWQILSIGYQNIQVAFEHLQVMYAVGDALASPQERTFIVRCLEYPWVRVLTTEDFYMLRNCGK